jgi:hypothetical protein
MRTQAPLGWMAATTMAALVSACGSSTSGELPDGGGGGHGSASGGTSGSGSGGGTSGSGSGGGTSGSGSGSGSSLFSGDASASSGDGGGPGAGCPIATIGVPGKWGQGALFMDWLSSQGESPSGNLGDQVLTASLLAPYKILVAQDLSSNHTYSAGEVSVLQAWITTGGGFMTMLGYHEPLTPPEGTNVNQLLAPYGMNYGSVPILADTPAANPVTQWVPHPVTQGITEVGFNNGFDVEGSGTFLASEQGYNLLEVKVVGGGKVLMWGDEWITYDAFWSQYPQFQVKQFWQNIVDWFDPNGGCMVPTPVQ